MFFHTGRITYVDDMKIQKTEIYGFLKYGKADKRLGNSVNIR